MKYFGIFIGCLLCLNMEAQYSLFSLNSGPSVAWKVSPVSATNSSIAALSSSDFNVSAWISATVPGTFFVDYVNAGLEATPEYADNIYQVDESKYNQPFWYRTEFEIPASFVKGKIWLNFDGTNKMGTVYLNGTQLGVIKGFMQRAKYDITNIVSTTGKNILLVRIDIPNQRHDRHPVGFDSFANYAMPEYMGSASWDWMPYVPGLNCGITNNVYLSNSGSVTLKDPWIRSELPDTTLADLSLQVEANNTASQAVSGTLSGLIMPGNITFSKQINLPANSDSIITLDKNEYAQLIIHNPSLWWPNGYGEQNLYDCHLYFTVNGVVSDEKDFSFGIRQYDYRTENAMLTFYINGEKILLRGGDWGISEYLVRCKGSEYEKKIKMHADMNYNIIRLWTGCVTDEEFYDYCDRYGIMVWDDFWLANAIGAPDDLNEFRSNATEKVKRLRNHPCILVWCGANESVPPAGLDNDLRNIITQYDGNDRRYQSNSRQGGGLTGSGFWNNFPSRSYFGDGIPSWGGDFGDLDKRWGMRSEIGLATFTTFESFREFIPQADWWPADYTQDAMWNDHFFGQSASNSNPGTYFNTVKQNYGESPGIEAFCEKAQYLNLEIGKAIYEGWNDHIWNDATGVILWMSNPAYPSFVWQTYDYYYDATGVYWGAKKACEPLHIQWNSANNSVKVINTTLHDYTNLKAKATVYNLDGSIYDPLSMEKTVDVPSNQALSCFTLDFGANNNLALNKPAYASGDDDPTRDASKAVDGDKSTRWASNYDDNAWIYIDFGEPIKFHQVNLFWETAYGRQYIIQVSNNASEWTDVFVQNNGKGGQESLSFDEVTARYIKLQGVKRATAWGYSLYEFQVFDTPPVIDNTKILSDLNFIRLELRDDDNQLLSDNFYWRNVNNADDYTALNSLPQAKLSSTTVKTQENGLYTIDYKLTNQSPTVAFGIRLRVVNARTGQRILPVFMNENYFTLMPGETGQIKISFDQSLIGNDDAMVLLKQYGYAEEKSPDETSISIPKSSPALQIYPNPASDTIYLNTGNKVFSIEIIDIKGRVVYKGNNNSTINISHLANGVYLLQATAGKEILTGKFVKQ